MGNDVQPLFQKLRCKLFQKCSCMVARPLVKSAHTVVRLVILETRKEISICACLLLTIVLLSAAFRILGQKALI